MLDLISIVQQLAQKDTVMIGDEAYKVKNLVAAADDDVMKIRVVLEAKPKLETFSIDIGISAKVYKS